MSFKTYVLNRRITDTPAGDFVKEVRRIGSLFPDAKTWFEVERHIRKWTNRREVLDAAKTVWRGYQRHLNASASR